MGWLRRLLCRHQWQFFNTGRVNDTEGSMPVWIFRCQKCGAKSYRLASNLR